MNKKYSLDLGMCVKARINTQDRQTCELKTEYTHKIIKDVS